LDRFVSCVALIAANACSAEQLKCDSTIAHVGHGTSREHLRSVTPRTTQWARNVEAQRLQYGGPS
jgi:hypothetical protein